MSIDVTGIHNIYYMIVGAYRFTRREGYLSKQVTLASVVP